MIKDNSAKDNDHGTHINVALVSRSGYTLERKLTGL